MSASEPYALFSDPSRLFADAAIAKRQRQAELAAILCAPPPAGAGARRSSAEELDRRAAELGAEYAASERQARPRAGSYDGGARASVPAPRDPVREHGELIASLAKLARTFGHGA
jgi:hypothetical protein